MNDATTRGPLLRRGLALEYATLAWNVIGVIVVAIAAVRAGSVALAGFGLDSLIEIFASIVVIWTLTGTAREREKPALRLIGLAFLALAAYILAQTVYTLASGGHPTSSALGIAWLGATVLAMLTLAYGKAAPGGSSGTPCWWRSRA